MKNSTKLVMAIVVTVALFIGVYFLYNKLKNTYEPNNVILNNSKEAVSDKSEENETSTEKNTSEDTKAASKESENENTNTEEKEKAPDFAVKDANGNTVKLSDFSDTPVIVNFWASWCPPCKSEMPDFNDAYNKYGNNIQFMMVNMTDGARETTEAASKFIDESGYDFPVYFDTEANAATTYSATSIPMTFFVDKDGMLVGYATGAIDAETLEKGIELIAPKTEEE